MRRYLIVLAAALLVAAALAGGGGAAPAGNDDTAISATNDSALTANIQSLSPNSGADVYGVGGGQTNGGLVNFDFSAHTGPQGDFGHVGVTQTSPTGALIVKYRLDVNCVHVHGPPGPFNQPFDRGLIRGVVTDVTPVPNVLGITEGAGRLIGIVDGGNQGTTSLLPPDTFFPFNFDLPGNLCKTFFLLGQANNVTQGNVNIKVG
jgi:hypothetical protein